MLNTAIQRGTLIMVGRNRKAGKREPNGRLARPHVNPRQQVALQPHRFEVPKDYREFPEAESAFGRLMLKKKITPAQFEAGKQYRELTTRYQSALMAPSPNPGSVSIEGGSRGIAAGMPDHTARAVQRAYNKAFEALGMAGNRVQRAVARHAVHDEAVQGDYSLDLLRCGLNWLVKHFGIDERLQISLRQK